LPGYQFTNGDLVANICGSDMGLGRECPFPHLQFM
jgi:hypothetical protein